MRTRSLAVAFLSTVTLVLTGAVSSVVANENHKNFNIDAQPAAAALNEFARQADITLVFSYDLVAGANTNTLKGSYSVAEGLARMLEGTSLSYQQLREGTIAISDRRMGKITGNVGTGGAEMRIAQAEGAAENDSVGASSLPAETPEGLKLEEVVVTAQKRSQNLDEVPISISVLSGEALDQSTLSGVGEILNSVPGVVTSTAVQGGGTQVAVRGVGASGPIFNGSSPIAYYLDSTPFGLVKTAVVPNSSAFDMARIEVLKGPQGTLYGATAQNGVVRVLTQDADLTRFDFKARGGFSSTDGGSGNYRADAAINVPLIEDKLAVRGVVGTEDMSGWIDGPVGNDVNDAEMRNYRLKINARPTQSLSIGFSTWLSRNEYGAPSSANDNGRIIETTEQPINTDYDAHSLKVEYEWTGVSLTSATSFLSFEQAGYLGLETLGFGPLDRMFTGLESDIFSQEIILQSAVKGAWNWSLGGFYRDGEDRLRQGATWLAPIDFSDYSESYAVFGQIGRRFAAERLEWTLGLRYFSDDVRNVDNLPTPDEPQHDQRRSFSALSPRAVLSWFPNPDTTVYASYAEGFRSGFPQNENVRRFPPIEPDELHNYELGLKATLLERRLSFEAAVYYIDWADVQQTVSALDSLGNCCFTALVNGESASGLGIDVGLTARPVDGLRLGLNVSWNDLGMDEDVRTVLAVSGGPPQQITLFNKGDRLNYSSELTMAASVDYDFPLGSSGWTGAISTSANHISQQDTRGLFGAPFLSEGDGLLIGRIAVSVLPPTRWSAMLFIDNVTNEDGAMPASLPFSEWQARGRPRTIGLQFEYRL